MRVIAAGSAVVLVVVAVFLVRPAPVVDLDRKVCDLLTKWAGPGEPSGRAVVVEIDEKSLTQYGRWLWPRDLVAQVTRSILDHGAAVVVLDMMFPQEDKRTHARSMAAARPGVEPTTRYSRRHSQVSRGRRRSTRATVLLTTSA